MKMKTKSNRTKNESLYKVYQSMRRSIISLPELERNLTAEIQELSQIYKPLSKCSVEYSYLLSSLRTIRDEFRNVYRSLSKIRRALENSKQSDSEIFLRLSDILKHSPYKERILKYIEYRGGTREYLKRVSHSLRPRHEKYKKAILDVKKTGKRTDMGKLAIHVAETLPETSGEDSIVYFLACFIKPLICVVVITVLVLLEGEANNGGSDDGGNGEDDGGMCYPEEETGDDMCYPEDEGGDGPIPQ